MKSWCHANAQPVCRALLSPIPCSAVLLEEAAEINEAAVVAALPATAQRLVMIGDHEQLRPKVNSFKLQARRPVTKCHSALLIAVLLPPF